MEITQQHFEVVLALERFKGLKTILDKLCSDREAQCKTISDASSYEDLIGRLGYRMTVTKQIHVQDAYARMGRSGGIKAVLPYYDIPTQSSFPTIVNFEAMVTTTVKAAVFFNEMLAALKTELKPKT